MTDEGEAKRQAYIDQKSVFMHIRQNCDHDFKGWRDFPDGSGGESVCTKCGIGAMSHSLHNSN